MKTVFLISICILFFQSIQGQELQIGDSTIVEQIKEQASKIYDNSDKISFSLTKNQLRTIKTQGTNITAYFKNDTINRIVAISLTRKGQLSTEWFFFKNRIIFVYDTFEFFDGQKNKGIWKNFKGLNGWESRYYFIDEKMGYQKHIGRKMEDLRLEADKVLDDGKRILNYLTKRND